MLTMLERAGPVTSDVRHLLLWAQWVQNARIELQNCIVAVDERLATRVSSLLRTDHCIDVLDFSAVAALPSPELPVPVGDEAPLHAHGTGAT